MKKIKQTIGMVICVFMLSILSVSAAEFSCQSAIGTGHGITTAKCAQQDLIQTGYYDDSSERYVVMLYVGPTGSPYKWSDGMSAGDRNASIYVNVGMQWNKYGHSHMYTSNRI